MKNGIPCPGCQEEYCCGFMHCTSPAKGNIVEEYRYSDGSRAIIMDAAYINKTQEELKEIENNARRIAWGIIVNKMKAEVVL